MNEWLSKRRRPAEAALSDPDQRAGNEVRPPQLDVSVTGQAMQDRNRVLVVDDDPGMLKAVQRLLRQHAYEPIVFSSAQAFKSHADFEKAAAVILDINLPDGSGIELRQGLKVAGIAVPVIFITGNENPAVREAALASGCIAFLTKPFSAQELIVPLQKVSAERS